MSRVNKTKGNLMDILNDLDEAKSMNAVKSH